MNVLKALAGALLSIPIVYVRGRWPKQTKRTLNLSMSEPLIPVDAEDGEALAEWDRTEAEYAKDSPVQALLEEQTERNPDPLRLTLLPQGVAADPNQTIGRVELLTSEERRQLLFEWNATTRDLPRVALPALFEAQVERSPEAIALVFEESKLGYAELNIRANRLAHFLIGQGIGPETLVALALPRSIEMIIALLGILKAGAAYLPLDPDYPVERLAYMLQDAQPACVLTSTRVAERLPDSVSIILLDHPETIRSLALSEQTNPADAQHIQPLNLNNPAYVIYTSGSTGTPKGVVITHAGVVNYATWALQAYHLNLGSGAPVNTLGL